MSRNCPGDAFDRSFFMTQDGVQQVACTASGWYAVYTSPRHEKRVAQHLLMRGIEHFLPLYSVKRRWSDGSKVTLQLPLFPSYVFVRMGQRERAKVLSVPGILSIVSGTRKEPAALPCEQMEALRKGLSTQRAEPHPLLLNGESVRIRCGALAGMEGIVVRVRNNFRVVLTLELIMRSIAVEVEQDNLEILSSQVRADDCAAMA